MGKETREAVRININPVEGLKLKWFKQHRHPQLVSGSESTSTQSRILGKQSIEVVAGRRPFFCAVVGRKKGANEEGSTSSKL